MKRASKRSSKPNIRPFNPDQSDGCTLWPDGWFGKDSWRWACVKHDEAYYYGGGYLARLTADVELLFDVTKTGHPCVAVVMFCGVRLFGGPYFKTRFRWGYGHSYIESNTYRKQKRSSKTC